MQLHTLQRQHPYKKPQPRVGRGGKRGTTSGRGQKGQHAHGGRRIPSGLKEMIQRLPKLRGFNNKSLFVKPQIINLDDLVKLLGSEQVTITSDLLAKAGLIKDKKIPVKLLGDGTIAKQITVEGILVSKSARTKIEAVGGTIK